MPRATRPSAGVPRSGGGAGFDRALPGARVQPKTPPLGARLPTTGGIRAAVADAPTGGSPVKSGMRFLRHDGIYRSDLVAKTIPTWGRVPPPVSRPRDPVKGRDGRNYAPYSLASSAMSSDRLFLDRVARQHCPSPLHRQAHPKTVPGSGTIKLQRTANSVLSVCLSPGGNPIRTCGAPRTLSGLESGRLPKALHHRRG